MGFDYFKWQEWDISEQNDRTNLWGYLYSSKYLTLCAYR